jgi:hypothetical protein
VPEPVDQHGALVFQLNWVILHSLRGGCSRVFLCNSCVTPVTYLPIPRAQLSLHGALHKMALSRDLAALFWRSLVTGGGSRCPTISRRVRVCARGVLFELLSCAWYLLCGCLRLPCYAGVVHIAHFAQEAVPMHPFVVIGHGFGRLSESLIVSVQCVLSTVSSQFAYIGATAARPRRSWQYSAPCDECPGVCALSALFRVLRIEVNGPGTRICCCRGAPELVFLN